MQTSIKTEPSLRFPEFTGQWREVYLCDFLVPTLRGVPKPKDQFRAVGIRSHCRGTFQRQSLDPEEISMDTLYVVREGDLIVNITFAWEGAIAIAQAEDDGGLVSHRFPTYVFNTEITGPDFFRHVFVQERFRYFLKVISPGGAGRNRILDKKDFLKLTVRLPELPEQEKIAAFLSVVDERVTQLTKKKELLLKYRDGVMQELFSQKIRFKDDDGNDFPDWEEREIIDVAPLQRGFDLPVNTIVPGQFPVVFSNGILKTHNEAKAKAPGVVTGRSGTIGKVTYVEKDYWPHNTSLWVTDFKGNHPKFVFYFYINFKLEKFGTGSGVPTLNRNDVHNQKVLIPSSPEQIKIADFISIVDEKLDLTNQQLEKTKVFKEGLLQQMFG